MVDFGAWKTIHCRMFRRDFKLGKPNVPQKANSSALQVHSFVNDMVNMMKHRIKLT